MWTQALLPFDILLLALTDRDDDAHALRLVVQLFPPISTALLRSPVSKFCARLPVGVFEGFIFVTCF